jgi:hypothetical protein
MFWWINRVASFCFVFSHKSRQKILGTHEIRISGPDWLHDYILAVRSKLPTLSCIGWNGCINSIYWFTAHGNNSCTHQPVHGRLLEGNQLALVLHVFGLVFIIDDAYPCSVNICQKHHKLALFLQTVYKCNSLLRYNTPVTGITVQQLCNYS